YTGVLAIFASRLLNNNPPMIFEDGKQQRDFVHVKDVATACRLAMESEAADGEVFNVGSGNNYSIESIAEKLAKVMGKENIPIEITGKYRVGVIRHCLADTSKIREKLGFGPRVDCEEGLLELADWLKTQIASDNVSKASKELASRGLTIYTESMNIAKNEAAALPVIGILEWFRPGEYEEVKNAIADLKKLGIKNLRTGISWADWYREGTEEWYDWLFKELDKQVEIIPCFLYTPPSI